MRATLAITVPLGLLVTLGPVAECRSQGVTPGKQHGSPVVVEVTSGRAFTATVDPRTDDTALWLRSRHGTMSILRPIRWDRVVQAEFEGQSLSAERLRQAVVEPEPRASADRATGTPHAGSFRLRSLRSTAADVTTSTPPGSGPPPLTTSEPSRGEAARVQSLAVDAWVANWDNDVEVDGLVVEVRPLDAAGAVAAAHGTLEVNLVGWRTGRTRPGESPARLGRWARAVRPNDFAGGRTEYRFPFQSVHPAFDLPWAAYGTVHVRLSVPGQGVFDATVSSVRIRPYSALRDHLQQTTGQRFYDVERTGRGRR